MRAIVWAGRFKRNDKHEKTGQHRLAADELCRKGFTITWQRLDPEVPPTFLYDTAKT